MTRRKVTKARHAHVEVVCPGMLEVLSVGKGDLKLTVGGSDPAEIDKARKVIEEMLRKGYGIFVETDKGPVRVKKFNPARMTYIISEVVEDDPAGELGAAPEMKALPPGETSRPRPKGRPRTRDREVPLAGSRATAIGRTSGG